MRMRQAIAIAWETAVGAVRALGAVLAWCVVGCFIAVTAVSILWKMNPSPLPELDGAAAALPSRMYVDMLRLEIPHLAAEADDEPSPLSARSVAVFLTKLTTGVDPNDPRTLAARLLPGEQGDHSVILIHGIGTGPADFPVEVPPAPHLQQTPGRTGPASEDPGTADRTDPEEPAATPPPASEPPPEDQPEPPPEEPDDPVDSPGAKIVFIYHSHPEESFLPELPGIEKVDEAFERNDPDKTVIAVGKHLAASLEKLGIGSVHSDLHYPWRGAYNESRKTVKAAMAAHDELTYFIDIHRDAARAEKTRLEVDGKSYARLFFVVGQKNPDYEKNQALAEELHYRIEAKVKGLSRGVVGKKNGSNGEFNQSLSPNSLLIEFGGVDNTLEECFRTAEVLAEVLAELHRERSGAVPANAVPSAGAPPAADERAGMTASR